MYTYGNPKYTFEQLKSEVIRSGRGTKLDDGGFSCHTKDLSSAATRLKGEATEPQQGSFADILKNTRSPWGRIQDVTPLPDEADGLFYVACAGHGGLWIANRWMKKLPKSYTPFTKNRRWAEEDQDAQIVLQHFGLLSLVPETTQLVVTAEDIESGRQSRKNFYNDPYFEHDANSTWRTNSGYYGGPLSDAFKRQTVLEGYDLVCTERILQRRPGGWKLCILSKEAADFMTAFDAGEDVKPTTFSLAPYVYPIDK